MEAETLTAIEAPAGSIGGEAHLMASGIGDSAEIVAAPRISGEAIRPPSPVHFRAARASSGDLWISWVRRSRQDWSWLSGSDTPVVGEESESYRLTISGSGASRNTSLAQPSFVYPVAEQSADGKEGPLTLSIMQTGTFAASRPTTLQAA